MKSLPTLAGCVCIALCAAPVSAMTVTYVANLNSAAENNPNNTSPGTGTAMVTIDFDLKTMHVDANFSGLQGQTTAAHIHCCAVPPTNAGVATTTPSFPDFPLGVFAGTYSHDFDMTQAASYNSSFITASGGTVDGAFAALTAGLDAGQAYFNIHSNLFSAGEIRGQLISQVPLPGALPLLLTGLVGCAVRARRRPGQGS